MAYFNIFVLLSLGQRHVYLSTVHKIAKLHVAMCIYLSIDSSINPTYSKFIQTLNRPLLVIQNSRVSIPSLRRKGNYIGVKREKEHYPKTQTVLYEYFTNKSLKKQNLYIMESTGTY
jgi:hypothetical protein